MKIALIGYGKMGRMIEEIARRRGHEIVCIIDEGEQDKFSSHAFASADAAIEFTVPKASVANILASFAAGVPVACGTTGWLGELPAVQALCAEGKGTLLQSTNFSIGVNIFRALSRRLTAIMNRFPQYSPELTEVHHVHKLDHPSGTAITIAEELIAASDKVNSWQEPCGGERHADAGVCEERVAADVLPVWHERRGEVPGIHTVTWRSEVDEISITHSAYSRRGFAESAVVAAEWLAGKPAGFYTINDVFEL